MTSPLRQSGASARLAAVVGLLAALYGTSLVLDVSSLRELSHLRTLVPDFPSQCFSGSRVDFSAPCASCAHFVTTVVTGARWPDKLHLVRSLRTLAATLRSSQGCFTLHAYTNTPKGGAFWDTLVSAAGPGVRIQRYPRDLPRNGYSGKNKWLELSRRKLDLLERYEAKWGRRAVWTDLDTVVAADLRCAIGRAPNFFVTRANNPNVVAGPGGRRISLNGARTTTGDLWMADAGLIGQIRGLERAGMPPPEYDIQDYAGVLMNACDGSLVDLRALVRAEGFARGGPMAFGFDCWNNVTPRPGRSTLKIVNGSLYCTAKYGNATRELPVATMSFHAPSFRTFLMTPEQYFKTSALRKWARNRGIMQLEQHIAQETASNHYIKPLEKQPSSEIFVIL